MASVEYQLHGPIAVLVVNNPPVNALSAAVRTDLLEAVRRTEADSAVKAVLLIGAGRTFVAGADIREFGKKQQGPNGRASIEAVEASRKPFVAALHGTALGGGLELALGAHFRVALASARVGLPEVIIGVIPGAGGTQRLPRIIGAAAALDVITSGKHIGAAEALELGIIDEIVPGSTYEDLLQGALGFAQKVLAEQRPLARVRDRADKIANTDQNLFRNFRAANEKKWRGLIAQPFVVDCIEAAVTQSFDDGYAMEHQLFERTRISPQRAALNHIFFAEREAAKIPGLAADIKPRKIHRVAVVGAGTMGGGIAMTFANAGIPVVQVEVTAEALERGRGIVRKNYDTSVSRGSTSRTQADRAFTLINGTLNYTDIAECDLVVEAAFEDMKIKQKIFSSLDAVMKPGALLATNTSTLDIDQIAGATRRPEDVVGMHFFSPANVMKLLECVRGARSSAQTLATAMSLAKEIGKVAVLAGNCDGFIGNRILAAYGRQADFLLEEGATPWQIDNALKSFGLPMGIFLMRDMAGLDIGWRVRQYREQFRDKSLRYSPIADRLCERGRFGQKTGAGYYTYEGRDATADPAIEELIAEAARELGVARKTISDAEIVERIIIAMVNEGAKIVGEGFAARASDIDVTYVHGYGFPRYRGGPMFWAEGEGLQRIYEKVRQYEREHGQYWTPARLLEKAARFGSWKAAEATV